MGSHCLPHPNTYRDFLVSVHREAVGGGGGESSDSMSGTLRPSPAHDGTYPGGGSRNREPPRISGKKGVGYQARGYHRKFQAGPVTGQTF